MNHKHYSSFSKIEGDCNFALLCNKAMDLLSSQRLFVAPLSTSFRDKRLSTYGYRETTAVVFYEMCLFETYLISAFEHLTRWRANATKYNTEFAGSWKYYALADRIESIKEYGGEDEDYNEDGTVKTDLTDEQLRGSDIVTQMTDYNDIFLTTNPGDWEIINTLLQQRSDFSLSKMFERMGKPILSYRSESGELIQNTWADERLLEAKEQYVSDSISEIINSVIDELCTLVKQVNSLRWNTDNKKFFANLPARIDAILNLEIESKKRGPQ